MVSEIIIILCDIRVFEYECIAVERTDYNA